MQEANSINKNLMQSDEKHLHDCIKGQYQNWSKMYPDRTECFKYVLKCIQITSSCYYYFLFKEAKLANFLLITFLFVSFGRINWTYKKISRGSSQPCDSYIECII